MDALRVLGFLRIERSEAIEQLERFERLERPVSDRCPTPHAYVSVAVDSG